MYQNSCDQCKRIAELTEDLDGLWKCPRCMPPMLNIKSVKVTRDDISWAHKALASPSTMKTAKKIKKPAYKLSYDKTDKVCTEISKGVRLPARLHLFGLEDNPQYQIIASREIIDALLRLGMIADKTEQILTIDDDKRKYTCYRMTTPLGKVLVVQKRHHLGAAIGFSLSLRKKKPAFIIDALKPIALDIARYNPSI